MTEVIDIPIFLGEFYISDHHLQEAFGGLLGFDLGRGPSHIGVHASGMHGEKAELRYGGVQNNAGAPIDTPPKMGLEHTYQMWSHDPDGNKIEFMQYTPESWQLVGR